MQEQFQKKESNPTEISTEAAGAQFNTIHATSGEDVTVRTDAEAMQAVGASNFEVGQTVLINGKHETMILGVAPMFADEVVSADNSGLHRAMLWTDTTMPDGSSHVGYMRLNPGETYDTFFS